jgi:hypothetical protein
MQDTDMLGRRNGCCDGIGLKTVNGGRRKRGGGEGNGMTYKNRRRRKTECMRGGRGAEKKEGIGESMEEEREEII